MNYKQGYRGDDLKQYQSQLGITADGVFGKQTNQAVRDFQQNNNLAVDGVIGKNTIAALAPKPAVADNKVTAETLTQPKIDVSNIPEPAVTSKSSPDFSTYLQQAGEVFQTDSATALERQRQQDIISALGEAPGRAELRTQAEEAMGLDAKRESYNKMSAKLQQLQAEEDTLTDRIDQYAEGKGVTKVGLAPTMSAQQKDLSIRKRYAVADYMAAQGDFQAAQEQISQAVEDQFFDRTVELENRKQQLEWLNEQEARTGQQRDKSLDLAFKVMEKDEEKLAQEKAVRKDISNIMMTARQNGASESIVERIQSAETLEDAIRLAGNSLQDPMVELQKQQIRQSMSLNREKFNFEKAKYATESALEKATSEISKLEEQGQISLAVEAANSKLDMQLRNIDLALQSKGLDNIVGSNFFGRAGSEVLGESDEARAYLGGLLSQDILSDFINAKAEGAVFGALSEAELNLLRESANNIAPRVQYTEDGRVDVIDMPESAFYRELDAMANTLRKAKDRNNVKLLDQSIVGEAAAYWQTN